MNIFNKAALQSMKKSPARTMVTIIGVILSTAMITAVASFSVSLLNYMVNGAMQKYGPWHVQFPDVDSSFLQEQARDERVASTAAYENIGYALLEGGQNPDKPYLFVAGFSQEALDSLPINLISGRLPENGREVLVPAHVAANGGVGFQLGDTVMLAVGNRMDGNKILGQNTPYDAGMETFVANTEQQPYTVVGLCLRPSFEEYTAPGYTLITTASGYGDRYSVFVTLANPRRVNGYIDSVAADCVLNDNVLRFMGLSDDTVFNALLYAVGGILVALIMVGSIFLIYNSFNISLSERTRQFGILSSVGATSRQLRNSVLFEGLCIGAIGIPVGILTGIGGIALVIPIVAGNFSTFAYSDVPLSLSVSLPAIAAAAAVSLITILISADIPARRAASRPVMESIRQTSTVKLESKDMETSRLAERAFGLPGTLGLKNFKRNKRRYRSIVLSLALSVVLFVSANAFGSDLKEGAERAVVDGDGDILFYTRDMEESEVFLLYDRFSTADGVTGSTYQAISTYSCVVNTSDLTSMFWESYQESAGLDRANETVELKLDLQFIEDGIYEEFMENLGLSIEEYNGQDANMIIVGKQPGEIDLFTGRSMDFTLGANSGEETKTIRTTFVDTYPLDPPPAEPSEIRGYVFMVVAPYRMKPQFDQLNAPEKLCLFFWSENPGRTTADMQAMLEGAGIPSTYTLYNVHKILEENRSILFVVDVFTYVFIIMISLIAVANVFNTISTNIKLRRRELAMLRSVGMSDRDFKKMMHVECALYGMKALLLGLPMAGFISWLIHKGLVAGGADIGFSFPWGSVGISVFGVFVIVLITMSYAVGKINRENIIDALRDDMT